MIRSPTCRSSTAIGICRSPSAEFINNLALAGCNSIRARIALEALPLARSNNACPNSTNPKSITGSSKKHCQPSCGTNKAIVLAKYAESVPKPTSEFMFGARYHKDFKPSHQIGRPIQPSATVEMIQWAYILPSKGKSATPIKPKCPTIAKITNEAGIPTSLLIPNQRVLGGFFDSSLGERSRLSINSATKPALAIASINCGAKSWVAVSLS